MAFVLPVHNEADSIAREVEVLSDYLANQEGQFEIHLVENGSSDDSAEVVRRMAAHPPQGADRNTRIFGASLENAGIGYAYDRGARDAWNGSRDSNAWVLFTAGDMPFGFSDFEQFRLLTKRPDLMFAVGSKAHHRSHVQTSTKRNVASTVYRGVRRLCLGMRTADSQGTLFVRNNLAKELAAQTEARGFFYSTEFIFWAERRGIQPIEVPVTLRPQVRPTTVRVMHHGMEMLRQTLALRGRAEREKP
ncbi:MAG: glycosyltransferase [Myxococcales bacterium]|nr:glycosyltransferase [Myxococcales bacterium]